MRVQSLPFTKTRQHLLSVRARRRQQRVSVIIIQTFASPHCFSFSSLIPSLSLSLFSHILRRYQHHVHDSLVQYFYTIVLYFILCLYFPKSFSHIYSLILLLLYLNFPFTSFHSFMMGLLISHLNAITRLSIFIIVSSVTVNFRTIKLKSIH